MKNRHCTHCGSPITTHEWLIAIEHHAPPGQKGCSVEFRFVNEELIKEVDPVEVAPTLGSDLCAELYLRRFLRRHSKAETNNAQGNESGTASNTHAVHLSPTAVPARSDDP